MCFCKYIWAVDWDTLPIYWKSKTFAKLFYLIRPLQINDQHGNSSLYSSKICVLKKKKKTQESHKNPTYLLGKSSRYSSLNLSGWGVWEICIISAFQRYGCQNFNFVVNMRRRRQRSKGLYNVFRKPINSLLFVWVFYLFSFCQESIFINVTCKERDLVGVLSRSCCCKWERSLQEFKEWCRKHPQYAKFRMAMELSFK